MPQSTLLDPAPSVAKQLIFSSSMTTLPQALTVWTAWSSMKMDRTFRHLYGIASFQHALGCAAHVSANRDDHSQFCHLTSQRTGITMLMGVRMSSATSVTPDTSIGKNVCADRLSSSGRHVGSITAVRSLARHTPWHCPVLLLTTPGALLNASQP